jgi:2-polyprenyl-6-methoxyphenol hydroxylase-like FAD-dependent oxidoreductase
VPNGAEERAVLYQRFGGAGWECDEILDALDGATDLYFDRVSQIRLRDWSRGHVTLVGDAAYCPSLLAGQGSALAMAGAYVLAYALAQTPSDAERAFAEYQRCFKPFVDDPIGARGAQSRDGDAAGAGARRVDRRALGRRSIHAAAGDPIIVVVTRDGASCTERAARVSLCS